MSKNLAKKLIAGLVVGFLVVNSIKATVNIDLVPVGNAENPADPLTGFGRVDYAYNIGKFEVTGGQYTAFLNAVAKTDTNALYDIDMGFPIYGGGITRRGSPGNYSYSILSEFINRPVNRVSFWTACRFVNWLENGQPTGMQDASTTETGTYTLTSASMAANTVTRNTGSNWAVASEDEWYKAAYFNPVSANYYLYPTSSNSPPGQDINDVSGNNANIYTAPFVYPIDLDLITTVAGEFQNSASPYRTFDQGGNLWEVNETRISGSNRGMRGGAFFYGSGVDQLRSDFRYDIDPTAATRDMGFRVIQLPEPASIVMLAAGVVRLLMRGRDFRR